MSKPTMPPDALEWLAFRYVANELEGVERDSFEERLAVDQAAREAVARSVLHTQALSRALAEADLAPVAPAPHGYTSPRRWALGLASCLALGLIVVLSQQLSHLPPESNSQSGVSSPVSAELAYAWAQTRDTLAAEEGVSEAVAADLDGHRNEEDEQSLSAPSWMVAAFASMGRDLESEPTQQVE